jgi:hypothetical protein
MKQDNIALPGLPDATARYQADAIGEALAREFWPGFLKVEKAPLDLPSTLGNVRMDLCS